MKPRIICDSSCDLPKDFLKNDEIDFSIVPLTFNVDGKEYIDDENLDTLEFLKAMKHSKTATSSACPSPENFANELRKNMENYVITMTSALSGTYNSARIAKDMVLEKNKDIKIALYDTLSTSPAMILIVMKLRDLIKSGTMDFETIAKKIDEYQKTLELRFLLQDLSNLVKTGRMSKVAGVVASALSIKPICQADEHGEIQLSEKVRGIKKALFKMAGMVEEKLQKESSFPVVITHCNNLEHAQTLKELLEERFGLHEIYIFPMHGLTTYYANDKGLIMAY
ncbi:DegV family protein [Eubacteriaceae bacterium ES3]|nr:DegV family protein [Eubacteriaceae bacterium ES3]